MKKIDFLITYEVKGRELEYLTLLMYELNSDCSRQEKSGVKR